MTLGNGKCPKCEAPVTQVRIQQVGVIETRRAEWRGITLSCPSCNVVLGVAVDPIDLKNFVVEEVVQKLRSVQ
jgi:hypothetical protein